MDCKYEVSNSVKCCDVVSLMPQMLCQRYVMICSSYLCVFSRDMLRFLLVQITTLREKSYRIPDITCLFIVNGAALCH